MGPRLQAPSNPRATWGRSWPAWDEEGLVGLKKSKNGGTCLVVQWLVCSQRRGPRFDPWLKYQILHATTQDPTCCN